MTADGVHGADQLEALGKRLKAAGDGGLKKELLAGLRTVNKPVIAAIREKARADLPHSGGLAEIVAKASIGTRTRVSGKSVGVTIKGTGRVRLATIDAGTVRHPTYGHAPYVDQKVKAGFFSETVEHELPTIRTGLVRVMEEVANKIAG